MKTVTVGIGNSDDKLSQLEWSMYARFIYLAIKEVAHEIHFYGFSAGGETWQNACWVFEIKNDDIPPLKKRLTAIRSNVWQKSIAWIEGDTEKI